MRMRNALSMAWLVLLRDVRHDHVCRVQLVQRGRLSKVELLEGQPDHGHCLELFSSRLQSRERLLALLRLGKDGHCGDLLLLGGGWLVLLLA